jgi:hypothetical protein
LKTVLLKTTETKYFDKADENVILYHNVGYSIGLPVAGAYPGSLSQSFNPWSDIVKGTCRQEWIRDQIIPRGMSIKLWMSNKLHRPNIMYHLMIVHMPKIISGAALTYNAVYPWHTSNQGSTGNTMILPLDKDCCIKAYYDCIFNVQQGSTYQGTVGKVGPYSQKALHEAQWHTQDCI